MAFVGLIALLGWQCGGSGDGGRAIAVGSKLDTEAQILGHLLALQLEAKGYSVRTKIPLGATNIIRTALTSKKVDVYWEFTGTRPQPARSAPDRRSSGGLRQGQGARRAPRA